MGRDLARRRSLAPLNSVGRRAFLCARASRTPASAQTRIERAVKRAGRMRVSGARMVVGAVPALIAVLFLWGLVLAPLWLPLACAALANELPTASIFPSLYRDTHMRDEALVRTQLI